MDRVEVKEEVRKLIGGAMLFMGIALFMSASGYLTDHLIVDWVGWSALGLLLLLTPESKTARR